MFICLLLLAHSMTGYIGYSVYICNSVKVATVLVHWLILCSN